MMLKQIKLLALCLLLTTNIATNAISKPAKIAIATYVAALVIIWCEDTYEASDYAYIKRHAQIYTKNDNDFIKDSFWAVHNAENTYSKIIKILNAGNLDNSANAIEELICHLCTYYSRLSPIYFRDLKIDISRINNLLAYKPQNANLLPLAQTYENLLQAKADLEKLANWLTPARIKLYTSSYHIINDYQVYDKSGNIDNHELIKTVIHNSLKENHSDILIYDFNYTTQVKQLRNKIQADLDQFLKASKWHTTPKSIENILAALDSLYNDAAKNLVKTNHEI